MQAYFYGMQRVRTGKLNNMDKETKFVNLAFTIYLIIALFMCWDLLSLSTFLSLKILFSVSIIGIIIFLLLLLKEFIQDSTPS